MSSNNNPGNRPQRPKNYVGPGKEVAKHGQGLGTGPVGSSTGHQGRKEAVNRPQVYRPQQTQQRPQQQQYQQQPTRAGGRSPLLFIIIAVVAVLALGGGGLSGLFGGGSDSGSGGGLADLLGGGATQQTSSSYTTQHSTSQTSPQSSGFSGTGSSFDLASLLGYSGLGGSSTTASVGGASDGWAGGNNLRRLDTSVAAGSRAKRTGILGGGRDTMTIMVYMCGTDLESKNGMATADLNEMISADIDPNINLIVYTGGCRQWRNSTISSTANQVYKVESGGLRRLVDNAGTPAMTDPDTLAEFIQFCAQNYPANRNELIFWDHGGGSLSGYGYDERNARSGSMSLSGIQKALQAGGVTFDFIGFDACLMATLENGLMLEKYADYMIASEETEPGVGWYYTDWLSALNGKLDTPTIQIGKSIADSFVAECNRKCRGQDTTLSVVDLAELSNTVPARLSAFAEGASQLIADGQYQTVSKARSGAREFSPSSRIDQVDLVHLARNLDTAESRALAQALLGAVKYNNTSSTINNAFGLSVYFPYRTSSTKVNSAVSTYDAIGVDDDYAKTIQQFAAYQGGGQAAAYGTGSPLDSLLGGLYGDSSSGLDGDALSSLLGSLLGGRSLDLDTRDATDYLQQNRFDARALTWAGDGTLSLPAEQWKLINDIQLSVFLDDGEGFIDLGLDDQYSFTDAGRLEGAFDGTWFSIDRQPVAYYHLSTVYDEDGGWTTTGRVPVLLGGDRADLIIVFSDQDPNGSIAGARRDYKDGETETVAKSFTELTQGDEIVFLCDYYSYAGDYQDSYRLGQPWSYHADALLGYADVDASKVQATYRLTDIYGTDYWTPGIPAA